MVIRGSGGDRTKLANSEPCNVCLFYMKLMNIRNCYYSNEEGDLVKIKVNETEETYYTPGHINYYAYIFGSSVKFVEYNRTPKKQDKWKPP